MSVRVLCTIQLCLVVEALLWSAVRTECTASEEDLDKSFEGLSDLVSVPPKKLLRVKYKDVEVCLGNQINPLQTAVEPDFSWDFDGRYNYTLALLDPDAVLGATFLHMMKINIMGGDVGTGQLVASYVPPAPPPGSGIHRYTFVVYQQRNHVKEDKDVVKAKTRMNFHIEDFADDHGFGIPVFGNYFTAVADLI